MLVNVRFNTECNDERLYWRVLIDGVEHLAENIQISVPCFTSKDFLSDQNVFKHHISYVANRLEWEERTLYIT
jgi:hypothetical protein